LTFVLAGFAQPALGQEELDPIIDSLERRAEEVTRLYPWLVQDFGGLAFSAHEISREEFLRGIHAATDLVFDGTETLDSRVSLVGRYKNIEEVLKTLCRDDPQLDCEIDFVTLQVRFVRRPDTTVGLPDSALIARYRQVRVDPSLVRRNYGMYYSGILIVDGSVFPAPLTFQLESLPTESRVVFEVNDFPITEFIYTDPALIDGSLYQATSVEELRIALLNKLDQTWRMTARFPLGTTAEMISLLSQQAQFLYGVTRSEPMKAGLRLHLTEGPPLDWVIPRSLPTQAVDGIDAYQKALQLQNRVIADLSMGGMVFLSRRFGNHALREPMTFQEKMNRVVSMEGDLRSKEKEIRVLWGDEAEWVLEYFYTSLVPDNWVDQTPAKPDLIPNTDVLAPVFETPVVEWSENEISEPMPPEPAEPATLPSDLLPLEVPSRGRGLVSPPSSEVPEDAADPTVYFENESEGESNGELDDPQP